MPSATRTRFACLNDVFACLNKPAIDLGREVNGTLYQSIGIDRQIAKARREMGEARWAELNAEWAS